MLNTTFALCHENGACIESYRKLAKELGGIKEYGENTPIPLSRIVEILGLEDALWAMRCIIEPSENILIEFACRCAEHVLHIYEDKYPEDMRPRQAIEAARICLNDKSPAARAAAGAAGAAAGAAAWAAWAAAWAAWAAAGAAWAAAWAAWAAAGAAGAAGAAEREWQKQTFLELLNTAVLETR